AAVACLCVRSAAPTAITTGYSSVIGSSRRSTAAAEPDSRKNATGRWRGHRQTRKMRLAQQRCPQEQETRGRVRGDVVQTEAREQTPPVRDAEEQGERGAGGAGWAPSAPPDRD